MDAIHEGFPLIREEDQAEINAQAVKALAESRPGAKDKDRGHGCNSEGFPSSVIVCEGNPLEEDQAT